MKKDCSTCSPNGYCSEAEEGQYACYCNPGFVGDGTICQGLFITHFIFVTYCCFLIMFLLDIDECNDIATGVKLVGCPKPITIMRNGTIITNSSFEGHLTAIITIRANLQVYNSSFSGNIRSAIILRGINSAFVEIINCTFYNNSVAITSNYGTFISRNNITLIIMVGLYLLKVATLLSLGITSLIIVHEVEEALGVLDPLQSFHFVPFAITLFFHTLQVVEGY